MARSVGSQCGSGFGRRLAVWLLLLAGITLSAQDFQSSFSPFQVERSKTPVSLHGVVSVDAPSGALLFDIPVGPGLGPKGELFPLAFSGRNASMSTYLQEKTRQAGTVLRVSSPSCSAGFGPGSLVAPLFSKEGVQWVTPDGKPGNCNIGKSWFLNQGTGHPLLSTFLEQDLPAPAKTFPRYATEWSTAVLPGTSKKVINIGSAGELVLGLFHPTEAPLVKMCSYISSDGSPIGTQDFPEDPEARLPRVYLIIKGELAYEYTFRGFLFLRATTKNPIPGYPIHYPPTNTTNSGPYMQVDESDFHQYDSAYYDAGGRLVGSLSRV